ncbi:MAG: hypothetical protein NTW69_20205, partial [Chloroflexi bacterium]|nr:hypothetical protein [Chloroflexota bacterium]
HTAHTRGTHTRTWKYWPIASQIFCASGSAPSREIFARPAPAEDDAISWGSEGAALTQAAWDASDPMRRAGQMRMVTAFFDEIFTHFDPYSRYVAPAEAAADRARRNGRGGIGVTVEPAKGSPQPTGQRIFKVDF